MSINRSGVLLPHEIDAIVAKYYWNKLSQCKERNIPFVLTFAQVKRLMLKKKCAYTGVLMTKSTTHSQRPTDFTIDRIDNSKGYEPGNVVACCFAANSFKGAVEGMIHNPLSLVEKANILLMAAKMIEANNKKGK